MTPVPVTTGSPSFRQLPIDTGTVINAWFPPGTEIAMHTHDHPIFAVMLRGGFDLHFPGRHHYCRTATLLIEPAGEPHGNTMHSTGADVLIVQPDPGNADRWQPFSDCLSRVCVQRHGAIAGLASRVSHELRCSDAFSPLAVESLCLEMLVAAARLRQSTTPGAPPAWLTRVANRLHDDPATPHRLRDLAADAGVHASELARVFRQHFHTSIGRYARRARVTWAAERLVSTRLPIARIAAEAGFTDQSHFTRVLKRTLGTTPAAYRRRASRA